MSLADKLAATPPTEPHTPRRSERPSGFEYEWDGNAGTIGKALDDKPRTWDDLIREADLDPDEVEVVGEPQIRGWDAAVGGGEVKRMRYFKINVRRRTLPVDIDELVKVAKQFRNTTGNARITNTADTKASQSIGYVVALGDLQLGKVDGDGVEGTVARFLEKTTAAVARYKRIAKGSPVYLIHLGDCIEGFMSQGGANAWRTSLTTTEQVRLYRRLLLEQIKAFAKVAPRLVVVSVPGNHDEAHRPLHTYGDSWAIDALSAVRDALELAGGYGHVTCVAPERDELTVTLDVCGTVIGMAHGHQFGAGVEGWKKWWQGQGHGRQSIGDADILLAGHKHHLSINQSGPRTFIQTPALESESTWWRHRTGEGGNPGVVTLLAGAGTWSALEVL